MTVEGVFFFINDNNKKIKESRFLDKKKKHNSCTLHKDFKIKSLCLKPESIRTSTKLDQNMYL